MTTTCRRSIAALVLVASGLVVPGLTQERQTPHQLALVGGTIYTDPAADAIRGGVILVDKGKIVRVGARDSVPIPPDAKVIDCSGLTITAGFWNSHVHFFERKWADAGEIPASELDKQLQSMLTRYGFTSAFDIGSNLENTLRLRKRVESAEVPGPRIRTTGEALVAPGVMPPDVVMRALGYMIFPSPAIASAAQADEQSGKLLASGADGVKIHLQPPASPNLPISADAMGVAVRNAHRAGKPVFVHPATGADILTSVHAGVDVIAHTTPFSGPWTEEIVRAMKDGRVGLTPTLAVWKHLLRHDRVSAQEQSVATAVAQLRAWTGTGGTVLFGSDLGAVGPDPLEEYTLMKEAGMSFPQILESLTTAPARRFGMSASLGRIAPGSIADLTVVRGDPGSDIRALADVQYTIRDGVFIYRRSGAPL